MMSRAILHARGSLIRLKTGCRMRAALLHRLASAPGSASGFVGMSFLAPPILPGSLFPRPKMTGRSKLEQHRPSAKDCVAHSVSLVSIAAMLIHERLFD